MQHAEELLKRQYTFLPVGHQLEAGHREVEAIFADLSRLPPEVLASLEVNLGGWVKRDPSLEDENDDGLLIRNGEERAEGGTYDHKLIWHQRVGLTEHYLDLGLYDQHEVLRRMCEACDRLHQTYTAALLRLANEIDRHPVLSGTGLGGDLHEYVNFLVLRLLRYLKTRSDDAMVVGQSHQDRDTITLHGYQSHGTIQCLVDGVMTDIRPPPHHLTVFTGMKAALRTGGELIVAKKAVEGGMLPALWHQGCITEADKDRTDPRRVTVGFSHSDNVRLF